MTDFKDLNRTDEFRFAEGGRTRVLAFYRLMSVNKVKVYGVDHEGNPFRVNLGVWDSLELATEDDFRRLAQEAEREALSAARRPEPPRLKEQATFAAAVLQSPDETCSIAEITEHWRTIRRAIESLPD